MQIAGVSVSTFNGVREEFCSAHDPTNLLAKYETREIQSIGIPAKLND